MLKRSRWPVILQIVPELSTGGAERTTIEMAEAVTRAGGKALVLSSGGRLEAELNAVGGELIRFPARTKNPAAIMFNALRIAAIVRSHGVSLIHARSRAPAWSAFLAARQTKRPFVTTYHGIYNQKGRIKAAYNAVMARGDVVICNSNYTAGIVAERHPEASEKIEVIHRGVDLARFSPASVSDERVQGVRRAWGVGSNTRIVLLPARLTRWKGQEIFLRAAAGLVREGAGRCVSFVLAGDEQSRSAYKAELSELASELGIEDRVVFAGHCEDMPAAYKSATLTVIPSIEPEAFGRVSIEAQAMGCPVIASRIGALPETMPPAEVLAHSEAVQAGTPHEFMPEDVQCSWLFEAGNVEALKDILKRKLALSEEVMQPLRRSVIEHARSRFSKQALQAQTLSVYDGLLGTQLCQTFTDAAGFRD